MAVPWVASGIHCLEAWSSGWFVESPHERMPTERESPINEWSRPKPPPLGIPTPLGFGFGTSNLFCLGMTKDTDVLINGRPPLVYHRKDILPRVVARSNGAWSFFSVRPSIFDTSASLRSSAKTTHRGRGRGAAGRGRGHGRLGGIGIKKT